MTDDPAFASSEALLKVIADPQACGVRLRDLQEQIAAARQATAELAAARAEHDEHVASTTAALDQRKDKLDQREIGLHRKVDELETKRKAIANVYKSACTIGDQVKRTVLRHAGWLDSFNERLQSLPSFDSLDQLVGAPIDAHSDMPLAAEIVETREGTTGDAFIPGSTLTRSMPMSSHDNLPMMPTPKVRERSRHRGYRAAMKAAMAKS